MVCLLHGTFLCQGLGDNHMMVEAFGANSGVIPVDLFGGYQGIPGDYHDDNCIMRLSTIVWRYHDYPSISLILG